MTNAGRAVRLVLASLLALGSAVSLAAAPESVTLQLKWQHPFQFAGYDAALEKGYYRDNDLDVRFVEADPESNVADEVMAGRADYSVSTSAPFLERSSGRPVVAPGRHRRGAAAVVSRRRRHSGHRRRGHHDRRFAGTTEPTHASRNERARNGGCGTHEE